MSEQAPEAESLESQDTAIEPAEGEYPEVGQYGYPEKMRWRDMRPEHQVAYWQRQAKQNEGRAKTNDQRVKDLEQKAAQWDALDEASKTEQQREVDRLKRELDATKAAQDEQRRSFGSQLVLTKLAAAAAGKGMTPAALSTLAGDPTRFLVDGGVDDEALGAFLDALPDATKPPAPLAPTSLGGGRRTEAKSSGLAAGADLYRQAHKRTTFAQP